MQRLVNADELDQNEAREERNHIGRFFILPDEIILHMLLLLEYIDIGCGASQLCHYLYGICCERFLGNLYGKSLRFDKWQSDILKELKSKTKTFNNRHQVTLFNRWHYSEIDSPNKLFKYYLNKMAYLFGAIFFLLVNHLMDMRSLMLSLVISFCAAAFLCLCHLSLSFLSAIRQNNAIMCTHVHQQHFIELQKFIEENTVFITHHLDKTVIHRTTIKEFYDYLWQDFKNVERLAVEFSRYLKMKKGSKVQFLDEADFERMRAIDPLLPIYAKEVAKLWYQYAPCEPLDKAEKTDRAAASSAKKIN